MTVKITLHLALAALIRNKARSMLTMLGIVIGVAAVIVTVAIGVGARTSVQQSIASSGLKPNRHTTGQRDADRRAHRLRRCFDAYARRRPRHCEAPGSGRRLTDGFAAHAGRRRREQLADDDYGRRPDLHVHPFVAARATGAFSTRTRSHRRRKSAVLGQTVVGQLFPNGDSPVGQTVIVKGAPFTVIGTLSALGQSGLGQDQDDIVLIPYTSAMERLTGLTTVNTLMVSAVSSAQIDPVTQSMTQLLERRHRIVPPQTDDFQVRNLQAIAQTASQTGTVMELLLAGVAAVSLIVGGIGIMNIMLVSVTERTREIGLRMAVGARGATILRQFLAESVVLSTIGGLIGVAAGAIGTIAVALLTHWPTAIPPQWVFASVAFSAMVGIFFGYYPARQAAQLNPIEALRFE